MVKLIKDPRWVQERGVITEQRSVRKRLKGKIAK
jgi:hypothetical protein